MGTMNKGCGEFAINCACVCVCVCSRCYYSCYQGLPLTHQSCNYSLPQQTDVSHCVKHALSEAEHRSAKKNQLYKKLRISLVIVFIHVHLRHTVFWTH